MNLKNLIPNNLLIHTIVVSIRVILDIKIGGVTCRRTKLRLFLCNRIGWFFKQVEKR